MKTLKTIFILIILIGYTQLSWAFFIQEDMLKKESKLPKPTHTDTDIVQAEIANLLGSTRGKLKVFNTKLKQTPLLRAVFKEQVYRPLWNHHNSSRSRIIKDLVKAVKESEKHGLNPSDYHLELLQEVIGKVRAFKDLARVELLLTDTFLQLTKDITQGRVVPTKFLDEWYLKPSQKIDVVEVLRTTLKTSSVLRQIQKLYPQDEQYKKLKEALVHYKKIQKKGPLPIVPKIGKKVEPGFKGPYILALRARLKFTNHLSQKVAKYAEFYDSDLEEVVKKYQRLNGLNDDGVIGGYTRAALNKPISKVISQLKANLERRRWVARTEVPKKYIYINIPDYHLQLIDHGKTKLRMRTIVGNKKWQTPVFTDELEYVVINPKWTVPPKIIEKETIPKIIENPSYIKKNNFTVYKKEKGKLVVINSEKVDWSKADPEEYTFSQKSGGGNALGRLKFIFPNKFSVYLHDTPVKSLFKKDFRAYSHGCIRVEEPLKLATYLFKPLIVKIGKKWDEERINSTIKSGKVITVVLKDKIPVLLRYVTAWVDEDDNVHLRRDIYEYDKKLARELKL